MTVYDELCQRFAQARARADARRERVRALLDRVGARVILRLGVPGNAHGWRDVETELEPAEGETQPSLSEVLRIDEEGVWHAGLQIVLRAGEPSDATLPLFFDLGVREEGDRLFVAIGEGNPPRRMLDGDESALDALAEEAELRVREWIAENLDRVLGGPGTAGHFGVYL